jgi:hypothetical protein
MDDELSAFRVQDSGFSNSCSGGWLIPATDSHVHWYTDPGTQGNREDKYMRWWIRTYVDTVMHTSLLQHSIGEAPCVRTACPVKSGDVNSTGIENFKLQIGF